MFIEGEIVLSTPKIYFQVVEWEREKAKKAKIAENRKKKKETPPPEISSDSEGTDDSEDFLDAEEGERAEPEVRECIEVSLLDPSEFR